MDVSFTNSVDIGATPLGFWFNFVSRASVTSVHGAQLRHFV